MPIQSFGKNFEISKLFKAREVARELTYQLSAKICPGMNESDAHKLYKELCNAHSINKQWHPPKIRFGPNTLCEFKEPSAPYSLKEEDIYFIDIGPVIEGHEADYGETFVIGQDYQHKLLAETCKKIFKEVSDHWAAERVSGGPLYSYAQSRAAKYGFHLSMSSDGHRIGDFPHQLHFKGGLAECSEPVLSNAWILEIHLHNPDKTFGAFFEDILTSEIN